MTMELRPVLQTTYIGKIIRKYSGFDRMEAGEYRYWQRRPVHERMDAASELTQQLMRSTARRAGCTRTSKNCCQPSDAHSVEYLVTGACAVSLQRACPCAGPYSTLLDLCPYWQPPCRHETFAFLSPPPVRCRAGYSLQLAYDPLMGRLGGIA
jgi:hypothetical protein